MTPQRKITVTKTNIAPVTIMNQTSPAFEKVQKAQSIRFYYAGGINLVCIRKTGPNEFAYNIPPISLVRDDEAPKVIEDRIQEIEAEMLEQHVSYNQHIVFDLKSKMMLTPKSFVDYPPIGNPQGCLFIVEDNKGQWDGVMYYLSDRTTGGSLAALSFFIAKMHLLHMTEGDGTDEGKLVLNFLVSEQCNVPYKFEKNKAPWNHHTYDFGETKQRVRWIDEKNLNLSAAIDVAEKIQSKAKGKKKKEEDKSTAIVKVEEDDAPESWKKAGMTPLHMRPAVRQVVMLSDVIAKGARYFYNKGYTPVFIDSMHDTIKEMSIDGNQRTCLVSLVNGAERRVSEKDLREDLQMDDLLIVENIMDFDRMLSEYPDVEHLPDF